MHSEELLHQNGALLPSYGKYMVDKEGVEFLKTRLEQVIKTPTRAEQKYPERRPNLQRDPESAEVEVQPSFRIRGSKPGGKRYFFRKYGVVSCAESAKASSCLFR